MKRWNDQDLYEEENIDSTQNDDSDGGVKPLGPGELPTALRSLRAKQYVFAAIMFALTTLLLVKFHTIQCALGYVVTVFLLYRGFSMAHDYAAGNIIEVAAVCTSLHRSPIRRFLGTSETRAVFSTKGKNPVFYKFNISGSVRDIDVDGVYILYFRKSDPNTLMTYIAV